MKSIIEEASSIFKAVENAWIKAGKPKDFTIKIYEEPERNFIGLVTKSAKVGIFFDDASILKHEQSAKKKQIIPENRPRHQEVKQQPEEKKPKIQRNAPIFNLEHRLEIKEEKTHAQKHVPKKETVHQAQAQSQEQEQKNLQPVWTDSMVENIQKWVNDTLESINIKNSFNVSTQNFSLKITFANEVFQDKNREKQFFASLSTLLLQMLKHKYRRPLKGYKIIIVCQ